MAAETDVDAGPEPTIVTPPGQAPEARHGRKGGKLPPAVQRAPARLATLTLVEIEPSPTNPRTIFADAYLDELAASIRDHGLAQMPLVRPIESKRKAITHQLVVGECRWRAAARAGLTSIQVLVEDLTDDQAYELQLEENGKRRDLHPLEESDAYHNALLRPGWTAERIAATSKLELSHVRARLRLQALTPATRDLFLAGKFGVEIANLLARQSLPAKLQEQAAGELAEGMDAGGSWESGKWVPNERRPPTVREAQQHLREKYMLRLERAPFPIDDADLVPEAGSCSACPKRSGNALELFPDVAKPDTCTDPSCFKAKTDAESARQIKAAKKDKLDVLPAAEAKKVFGGGVDNQTGLSRTAYGGKLAAIEEQLPHEVTKGKSSGTWGELIEKLEKPPAAIVAKDPHSGAVRKLVDKNQVIAAARKEGVLKPEKKKASSSTSTKPSGPSPAALERDKEEAIEEAVIDRLAEAFGSTTALPKFRLAWSRWVAVVYATIGYGTHRVLKRRGLKGGGPADIAAFAKKLKSATELDRLLQEMMLSDLLDNSEEELIAEGCKVLGIDRKKLLEAATKTVEAELAIADKKKAAKGKSR